MGLSLSSKIRTINPNFQATAAWAVTGFSLSRPHKGVDSLLLTKFDKSGPLPHVESVK